MNALAHGSGMLNEQSLVLLGGPTAVGKSEVALELAERLGGEIVSVDSMQVYRGMDIGTAKPGADDRRRVPHHLIDVVEVTEPFNAARFAALAWDAVRAIWARGRTAVLCGGSGLYFKAFLEGVGQGPAPDPNLRRELESLPTDVLLAELAKLDPETYAKIDRRNRRRVVRAVEVVRLTGKPFSALKSAWGDQAVLQGLYARFFVITRAPADLRARIDSRVERMFQLGLVEETRQLLARGLESNPTAMQALGYRQVVEYLRGLRTLEETIQLVKVRTWQFARRQLTWFRHQTRAQWLHVTSEMDPRQIAELILARLQLQDRG